MTLPGKPGAGGLRRALRSPRLTLVLCLLGAAGGAVGTMLPAGALGRPLYAALFAALALNVAFCTGERLLAAHRPPGRPRLRLGLDVLTHLSLILLLAGAGIRWLFGSVGTQYLFVGQEAVTVRSGGDGPEVPLGFGLLLKDLWEEHYPVAVQVGVRETATGQAVAFATLGAGRTALIPEAGLRLTVADGDPSQGWVTLSVASEAGQSDLRLATVAGEGSRARFGRHTLELLAWRRDLRAVRGRVAITEGGRELREGRLEVNGRLAHRGTSVYLTAWGRDEYGNAYLGVQASRDPGAPIFWTGAALLGLSAPLFLISRRRGRAG